MSQRKAIWLPPHGPTQSQCLDGVTRLRVPRGDEPGRGQRTDWGPPHWPIRMTRMDKAQASILYKKTANCHVDQKFESAGCIDVVTAVSV